MSAHNKELLQDYLRKRHSVSKLVVHLVFTTKYRRKLFTGVMIEQLREAFESACVKLECELIEMDGEQDHVHLLISYPPKLSISVMVNNLKAVSSRMLRLQNTHLTRQSKTSALWSRSYFACTAGGATIETLKAYVESQSTPD
ncbi:MULTISPECIES: IS200/IS605 family transposase [Vibrio]|uniref:IS200/IS605 family transposase n=4 Tax=Vibrio TaxID=662 RepID=A0AA92LX33_9VIBR|nr:MULTISPECIES: IS200/IS605 family transposase [Vibrio]MCF7455113.1 IS200/IS605 family transposase [Vibrio sp. A1-1]MCG3760401.1 IS200/IS605 family transposase [Vibrio cincinnatiensis]ANP63494.1 transposase [Vibrio alginolyticus]EGQ8578702.1 IS200/IS605 family transposase [Vibrio cholerae]EGQ8650682.1 IS200/IS605 family transposase [Vibrio cholerae]